MKYDPQKYHRRSIRLKGYDYSQAGMYYFTIVAQQRACLFGSIENGEMALNDAGRMLWEQWNALSQRFTDVELDEFIVMPNHIHGILLITDTEIKMRRGDPCGRPSPLPDVPSLPNRGQAQGIAPYAESDLRHYFGRVEINCYG